MIFVFKEIYTDLENLFLGCSDLLSSCFLRAKKERTFLSALIKKFHGVLASIPPTGKKCLHISWEIALHNNLIRTFFTS